MKIKLESDLHIDFEDHNPCLKDIDVYVLAGDVGEFKNIMPWLYDILELNQHVKIIHVIGNHVAYGHKNIDIIEQKLHEFSSWHPRYCFLQNSSIEISGIKFIGATLWTDYNNNNPIDMSMSLSYLSDYRQIKHKMGDANNPISYPWRPEEAYKRHLYSRKYIFEELKKGYSNQKQIVITHHKPYASDNSPLFASYESNLDKEINVCNNVPKYWLYGHTHKADNTKIEYNNGCCTFLSNPKGYPGENIGFDKNFTLEINNE